MSGTTRIDGDRHEDGRYEIRLKGHLDGRWAAWFDGLSLSHESDGVTVIRGGVPDQAALHGSAPEGARHRIAIGLGDASRRRPDRDARHRASIAQHEHTKGKPT